MEETKTPIKETVLLWKLDSLNYLGLFGLGIVKSDHFCKSKTHLHISFFVKFFPINDDFVLFNSQFLLNWGQKN